MSPYGGELPLPGGAGRDRNHQQSARSLQEPRAAVRDLLCSRMPAPVCVLADGECRAGLQWLAPKAERGTDRCGPY